MSDADLRQLLTLPVMVILDEAYIEFADAPSRASWVLEYDNLVVLRTFSKAAGIAGLRLGYGQEVPHEHAQCESHPAGTAGKR